jgi:hypothetical protein
MEPWRREGLRIAMLAGPGSGKSWNNSLLAEQFLQQGGTVVIFQPRDEYFTLKEKFDILSVGGVHAKDIEFALTSPSLYAKAVVEEGISMIFYTSSVEDEQKLIDWVSRFISLVLKYQEQHRRPLLLILEEAQEYAPRSASGHVAPPWVYNRMIKAFKDCFTQGRKLNIIAIASSQRPQELNFTIRQLANLTFYGKFSDQDIGYIDKECLKYVRKHGIQIEAEKLVDFGLGEWLAIMGKKSRFVKVDALRITRHGAETPRLEYVAPRPTEAKKTIDELSKSILAALEKEETEKSELEKAKKEIRCLKSQVEALEEKANIKLSVKEMIEGPGQGVGSNPTNTNEELIELREESADLKRKNEYLELKLKSSTERLDQAEKNLKAFDELRSWLRIALGIQNIYDNIHRVEELAKSRPRVSEKSPSSTDSKAVGLQRVVTVVNVDPAKKVLPKVSTDTVKGKVLALVLQGFFSNWKSLSEIRSKLSELAWGPTTPQAVNGALGELVKDGILGMRHTDRNRWKLAPDVVFQGKEVSS